MINYQLTFLQYCVSTHS